MELHTQNETGEGFSGEIRAFNGTVSGTLTNNYSYAVENAAILLYNQLLLIGNIEPGETISLDNRQVTFCATNFSYALASQITGVIFTVIMHRPVWLLLEEEKKIWIS